MERRRGWEGGGLCLTRCISVDVCVALTDFLGGKRDLAMLFWIPNLRLYSFISFLHNNFPRFWKQGLMDGLDGCMWMQMCILVYRAQDDGGGKEERDVLSAGFACVSARIGGGGGVYRYIYRYRDGKGSIGTGMDRNWKSIHVTPSQATSLQP